jgi:ubiquinone/menaquinone biosynthesis C-methylase UbiE
MNFNNEIFEKYLQEAPLPLAMERYLECEIYKTKEFAHPILDIGCGEGMFAHILFKDKIDVGIDPNSKELERAKEYGAYSELINCYGNEIAKEDKSFNTIFTNSVLEHIPDIDAVLKESHRLLCDSGRMYVTIPTDMFDKYSVIYQILSFLQLTSLKEKYRVFFNKFWAHYHYYDLEGWKKLFEKNGFEVVYVEEYGTKKQCVLNDFLAPFSIIPFIVKKYANKWFLFPSVRKVVAKILDSLFLSFVKIKKKEDERGGLIFFELKKSI